MYNKKYIINLIKYGRSGLLIKLVNDNLHLFSLNDFKYIFQKCVMNNQYNVFYYMMEYFCKRSTISEYFYSEHFVDHIMDDYYHPTDLFTQLADVCDTRFMKYIPNACIYNNILEYASINEWYDHDILKFMIHTTLYDAHMPIIHSLTDDALKYISQDAIFMMNPKRFIRPFNSVILILSAIDIMPIQCKKYLKSEDMQIKFNMKSIIESI